MTNLEKTVTATDAFLDCIPFASTVSNLSAALYKLVHKVDALNPVAPGLKTTLKIHVLNKSYRDCLVGAIPLIGNLIRFVEHILSLFNEYPCPIILKALRENNAEIVHLSLKNGALKDKTIAERALYLAAEKSNHELFAQILKSRNDWSTDILVDSLYNCSFYSTMTEDQVQNSYALLGLLGAEKMQKALTIYQRPHFIGIAQRFLKDGKIGLAQSILYGVAPELGELLWCFQLERGPRSQPLKELKGFLTLSDPGIAFEAASLMLEFFPEKLGDEEWTLIDSILEQWGLQFSFEEKVCFLKALLPSASLMHQSANRSAVFAKCVAQWKNELQPQAHEIYSAICAHIRNVGIDYRSLQLFGALQRTLILTFPDCQTTPSPKPVSQSHPG